MIERKILASAAKSRSAYETIATCLEPQELGAIYAPVWAAISEYYERDPKAPSADLAIITDRVSSVGAGAKRQNSLKALCSEIWSEDVSPANVAEYVRTHALDSAAMRFAQAAAARKGHGELEGMARAYVALLEAPEAVDAGDAELTYSQALRKRVDRKHRIKVTPGCLNENLGGGVVQGTNVTIVGRPNKGKTALALTMACGFVRRGLRVLWLTNEDPALSCMVRATCNVTGLTELEIEEDPDRAERLAIEKGITRLIFRDIHPGTPPEIEGHIKATNPQVLVLDQLRNIHMKGTDGNTNRLDAAAQFLRAMGKKYGLVTIGMAQQDAASAGKLVPDNEDIDSSKTGIPGAADVIIFTTGNDALESAGQRMLTLAKNKLSNIHTNWQVQFDPFRSRYARLKTA